MPPLPRHNAGAPAPEPEPIRYRVLEGASLSDQEFALFQAYILREAGIYLSPIKKALLVGRLSKRLRELGLTSFGAYYRRIRQGDEAERTRFLNAISTNETHFFREPNQWQHLETVIGPAWRQEANLGRRPRAIRAWSAACSSGEEPYTLAMVLADLFPSLEGWSVDVVASDLSTRCLTTARRAIYPIEQAEEIPSRYRQRFLLRGTGSQAGKMKISPMIRSLVRFFHMNLNEEAWPVDGPFDLVFCRNVIMYFSTTAKTQVLVRLVDRLAAGGYLFVGHAESLTGMMPGLRAVVPTVYSRD